MSPDPRRNLTERIELLQEMQRIVEVMLEHQVKALGELDDKTALLLRLGVLALVGGIGLVSLLLQAVPDQVTLQVVVLLIMGALLNLVALQFLLSSFLGIKKSMNVIVGPSPNWIREKSRDRKWGKEQHLLSILNAMPKYFSFNERQKLAASRRSTAGLYALFFTVTVYSTTMVYIVSGVMWS